MQKPFAQTEGFLLIAHVAQDKFCDKESASNFYKSSKKGRKQPYNWWVLRLYGLIYR
jgi:hypothetical protein